MEFQNIPVLATVAVDVTTNSKDILFTRLECCATAVYPHQFLQRVSKHYAAPCPPVLTAAIRQCFSTAGPWHQLYRAARGSPGICHFSFI